MAIRCYNRVSLLLACLLLLVVALPFVNYAPNRLLSGEGRWLWQLAPWLTAVQVCGALLLALADYSAQRLFMPYQLPVGVVTVSLGGIYLIALLIQESRKK